MLLGRKATNQPSNKPPYGPHSTFSVGQCVSNSHSASVPSVREKRFQPTQAGSRSASVHAEHGSVPLPEIQLHHRPAKARSCPV